MSEIIKPKKSLGQHWLYDIHVLSDIAELAEITEEDHIVEIGPGLGTLTEVLLSYGAHVTAVEFDTEIYQKLKKESSVLYSKDLARLKIVNEDILRFDFSKQKPGYKVVANIPYYLTSNLIRVLSETPNRPEKIVLLVQKEVAERICAGPGNMSLLSVWAQMYFRCELGPIVLAKLFTPPPKVDSQVVIMDKLESPKYASADKKVLERLIKSGFSNKRKTLNNSLSAGLQIDKSVAAELLEASGINQQSRAQELSIENWIKLANIYADTNIT